MKPAKDISQKKPHVLRKSAAGRAEWIERKKSQKPPGYKQVWRFCPWCNTSTMLASLNGHSIGLLHAICSVCRNCLDCDEGNV